MIVCQRCGEKANGTYVVSVTEFAKGVNGVEVDRIEVGLCQRHLEKLRSFVQSQGEDILERVVTKDKKGNTLGWTYRRKDAS